MKTFDPTKTTLYIFIAGLLGAALIGGGAILWMQSQIVYEVNQKIEELKNTGALPEGPPGPAGTGGASLPVGSILTFYGSPTDYPDGFIACDGSVIDESRYPELYKVLVAATPGRKTGDGFVQLPNLNAKFLRGAYPESPVGSTGGTATHSHSVTIDTAENKGKEPPGHRNDVAFNYIDAHLHSATSGVVDNLPPYENVSFLIRAE